MATRHLRKLQAAQQQQQRVAQQQQHSDDDSDKDGSGSAAEAVSPPGRAPFNPFDLLDGDSDGGGDSGGDSGNEVCVCVGGAGERHLVFVCSSARRVL
jgi:hypothetical protein